MSINSDFCGPLFHAFCWIGCVWKKGFCSESKQALKDSFSSDRILQSSLLAYWYRAMTVYILKSMVCLRGQPCWQARGNSHIVPSPWIFLFVVFWFFIISFPKCMLKISSSCFLLKNVSSCCCISFIPLPELVTFKALCVTFLALCARVLSFHKILSRIQMFIWSFYSLWHCFEFQCKCMYTAMLVYVLRINVICDLHRLEGKEAFSD